MKILALDLGKFNSVSCFYDTKTHSTEFWTCATNRPYLRTMLEKSAYPVTACDRQLVPKSLHRDHRTRLAEGSHRH